MRSLFLSTVAVLCLTAQVFAQGKTVVDLTNNPKLQALLKATATLPDGSYELKIVGGTVTVVPLTWWTPDGPTPPPQPDLTARAKEIKAAVLTVQDPDKVLNTKKLSALYKEVQKQVSAGTLKGQQTIALVVKGAQDMLLSSAASNWKPVTDKFGEHWAAMVQEGRSDPDYATYLGEAASGLDSTLPAAVAADVTDAAIEKAVAAAVLLNTPGVKVSQLQPVLNDLRQLDQKAIDPALLKLIIELIMKIIEILIPKEPAAATGMLLPELPLPVTRPQPIYVNFYMEATVAV